MKMTFIGATHEVTGSCNYLEVCGKRLLVDFGMEQGRDTYENVKIPCAPSQIDYVLLTHAHIDHSGLLPLLYAGGFSGEIHATSATCSLCEIMQKGSEERSMRQEQQPIYVRSCCKTVHTFRNSKRNGETARQCEKAANPMCRCTP